MGKLPVWSRDLTALAARFGIGFAWLAHGWPKIQNPSKVATMFTKMHVFAPPLSAWYASIVESIGAIALIIGLALPVVGILLFADAIGVILNTVGVSGLTHWAADSQLVLVLGLGALVVGFHGGRYSLDQLLFARRGPFAAEGLPVTG